MASPSPSSSSSASSSCAHTFRSSLPRCAVVTFTRKDDILVWEPRVSFNTGGLGARVGDFHDAFKLHEFSSRALAFSMYNNDEEREDLNFSTLKFRDSISTRSPPPSYPTFVRTPSPPPSPRQGARNRLYCSVLSCVGLAKRGANRCDDEAIRMDIEVLKRFGCSPSFVSRKGRPESKRLLRLPPMDIANWCNEVKNLAISNRDAKRRQNLCDRCKYYVCNEQLPVYASCVNCDVRRKEAQLMYGSRD